MIICPVCQSHNIVARVGGTSFCRRCGWTGRTAETRVHEEKFKRDKKRDKRGEGENARTNKKHRK